MPLGDRTPVRHRRSTQRVGADPHAGSLDGVDVDDRRQVVDVGAHEVVRRARGPRPGERRAPHVGHGESPSSGWFATIPASPSPSPASGHHARSRPSPSGARCGRWRRWCTAGRPFRSRSDTPRRWPSAGAVTSTTSSRPSGSGRSRSTARGREGPGSCPRHDDAARTLVDPRAERDAGGPAERTSRQPGTAVLHCHQVTAEYRCPVRIRRLSEQARSLSLVPTGCGLRVAR